MARSALKLALAAEKGKDPREKKAKRILKEKQAAKLAKKNRGIQQVDSEDEEEDDAEVGGAALEGDDDDDEEMGDNDDEEDEEENEVSSCAPLRPKTSRLLGVQLLDLEALNDTDSDSGSDIEMEEKIIRPKNDPPKRKDGLGPQRTKIIDEPEDDEDEDDEEEEEEDVLLSDIEDEEDREDIVPHTRLTINNKAALLASLNRIKIDTSASAPFVSHQSLVSSKPTADAIPDVSDDLQRELAFLSQSLEAARKGRALLVKEGVPFTRPGDYFAEMAKDDGQMEKVRAKLVEEATAKKAAAEARKLRDLKKFGKQVQVAKLQERQKAKRETLDKIKALKKSASSPVTPLVTAPVSLLTPHRAPGERLRRRRHHRRRPLRRCRRRGTQGLQGQVGQPALRLRPRRHGPQRQAPEQERKVRLWRKEALLQVRRRLQLRRCERLQQPSRRRRRSRRRCLQGPCGQDQAAETWQGPQEGHGEQVGHLLGVEGSIDTCAEDTL